MKGIWEGEGKETENNEIKLVSLLLFYRLTLTEQQGEGSINNFFFAFPFKIIVAHDI